MLLHFAMAENTLRKSIPSFPLSANAALTSRLGAPREGSYTPATRLARGAQRRDTHAGTKTCHRHVFLASLVPCSSLGPRHSKKKHHPDGWCFLFGAGDEESAEAPPAAEEARRFRGSVLTAGRGSGWEPADTTVSAEEHAKKITTHLGGDLWSGRRGSNSLPRPWQGRALPDELRPQTAPLLRHLGASGRSRTNDTRIFSPLLYQLSYRGIWRPRRGSNPRPPA